MFRTGQGSVTLRAMRILYHLPLSAHCRQVRISLAEHGLEAELWPEKIWERRQEFLALNPAGEVPVLVEDGGAPVCGVWAICEYIEDAYGSGDNGDGGNGPSLLGRDPAERAETRRLVDWFARKFDMEVTENLVGEKLLKRFMGLGQPDSAAIKAGRHNIHYHLDYIAWLTERRNWLAGEHFSLADIAAAAQISCVDYLGDVPWADHELAKDWYVRVKSRPCFRSILADLMPGCPPPAHYADLDF